MLVTVSRCQYVLEAFSIFDLRRSDDCVGADGSSRRNKLLRFGQLLASQAPRYCFPTIHVRSRELWSQIWN